MMDIELKRPTFDDFFPPAACSHELREQLRAYAKAEGASESAVLRAAVRFFLLAHSGNATSIETANGADVEEENRRDTRIDVA